MMRDKINIGIVGYGNLGKAVEAAITQNSDLTLRAIFTRRNPENIEGNSKILHISKIKEFIGEIDVMVLCGGSATDLPHQSCEISEYFNIVDSFDTHAKIEEHYQSVDKVCRENNNVALLSIGWDPGVFSLNRLLGQSVLPSGKGYTFWGRGVSQGHSDAIRRVDGVKYGIQYTIPVEQSIDRIRNGETPEFTPREMHERVCYIVPEEGADLDYITNTIKKMRNYFDEYNTTINFITEEEFKKDHSGIPHGGFVIYSGNSAHNKKSNIEFKLTLDSNPEFTGSVLVAYARAAYRLHKEGKVGAHTIFDVPLSYLSPKTGEELRKELL